MPGGKILSDKEQGQVIVFNELGLSQREIAKNWTGTECYLQFSQSDF